jgi:hypothetical protein
VRPVIFQCSRIIFRPATEISAEIANTDRWSEFKGYGILPGIESAEYESRTASMIGSRIRVRNTDGSRHVEEISKWVAGKEVSITLKEFTRPLSYVATHFVEEWRFESNETATHVIRRFQMFASGRATRPIVWLISLLFRRAIVRHLAQL